MTNIERIIFPFDRRCFNFVLNDFIEGMADNRISIQDLNSLFDSFSRETNDYKDIRAIWNTIRGVSIGGLILVIFGFICLCVGLSEDYYPSPFESTLFSLGFYLLIITGLFMVILNVILIMRLRSGTERIKWAIADIISRFNIEKKNSGVRFVLPSCEHLAWIELWLDYKRIPTHFSPQIIRNTTPVSTPFNFNANSGFTNLEGNHQNLQEPLLQDETQVEDNFEYPKDNNLGLEGRN